MKREDENAEALDECRRLNIRGIAWLTASSIFFALMAICVRIAGKAGVPGSESTLIRFVFGLVVIGVMVASGRARLTIGRFPLLVARGVSGGLSILLYFLSISAANGPGAVPLTNSVFLSNSYFIYTPAVSALFIRERLRPGTISTSLVALAGLGLFIGPHLREFRAGDVYGFASGVASAASIVVLRELRKSEDPISIFFSLCVVGVIVSLPLMFIEGFVAPDLRTSIVLLLMVIAGTAGQLAFTYAMRFSHANEGSILELSTVIYSSGAGIMWLGDPFDLRIALGAALVLGSAAYVSLYETIHPRCDWGNVG
jgi:drug/metabolite transporter (DMT)-like permease